MQKKLVYVDSVKGTAKASGREYNLVSLSNGIRTGTIGNDKNLDFSTYNEGDEILVTFDLTLNYKNEFVVVPVKIEKVK